eukprot:14450485-Heterocapsa_arctica.AAC.1
MSAIIRLPGSSDALTEFCMYGKPWRKSTRLIGFNLDLSPLEHYRCIGAARGLCKRTGKPHQVLSGSHQGTFWTLIAQPCPRKFCSVVA